MMSHPAAFLEFLNRSLDDIAAGRVGVDQPKKQIFDDPGGGDFRVMPCVVKGPDGLFKTVKVVGTNVAGLNVPDQVTVGKAMVLHPVENYVTHVVDACLLSSARTAACAVAGVLRMDRRPERVFILGAGRVGYYLGVFLAAAFPQVRLGFADSLSQRAERLARELRELEIGAEAVSSLKEWPADLAILATTSAEPVLCRSEAGAMAVVSVGADTPWQRELADDWAAEAAVLVDTVDSLHVGDLLAWSESGRRLPRLAPITQALPRGLRLFISTGSALFDNLALRFVLASLESSNSGLNLDRRELIKP